MKQTDNTSRGTAGRGGRTLILLALVGFMLIASVLVVGLVGLTAYALLVPQRGAPAEPALTWHREGGLAGFCEEVVVYATGEANLYSCQDGRPAEIGQVRLDEQQLAALARWMDTLQPFEVEQDNLGTADGMAVRLSFSGTGEKAAEEADRQLMMDLAQALYNEGRGLAADADGLEPLQFTPGSSAAMVSGTATALAPKRYVLRGLEGQTLSVVLETASLQTYITALHPNGENMAGADGPIHQWSGRLPVDGDYVVEVINPGNEAVDFELAATLSRAPEVGSGDGVEPVEVLVQLDWEGGFTPPEVAVPFGRVPAFTLLADGRVLYLDWDDTAEVFREQVLIAQLRQDETEALLQQVLDMGFEGLESYLDFCMALDDGTSQCVADAGYSILRVRLPEGDLREIRNWAGFANDPEALASILDLLSNYRHPEAVPYVPDKASLFIQPIPSVEGVKVEDWPLDPGWLAPPAPAVEQWAGVLAGEEWDTLLQGSPWNVGTRYYRHADRYYQVVLVPWLPGTDYTDAVLAYRFP